MFSRFLVALFLLSAVCGVMSASVALDDADKLSEKLEKDDDLKVSSKSVNETTQDIKFKNVTTQLTKLKANVIDAISAANSTSKANSSVESIKQDSTERTTPKVTLDCKTTTCSTRNGITTCKISTNCTSAKLKANTTEKVTTLKTPILDDASSQKED